MPAVALDPKQGEQTGVPEMDLQLLPYDGAARKPVLRVVFPASDVTFRRGAYWHDSGSGRCELARAGFQLVPPFGHFARLIP